MTIDHMFYYTMTDKTKDLPPSASKLSINSNGGAFRSGLPYTADQKWRFICQYKELKASGASLSRRAVAKKLGIGYTYAGKIISEGESGNFVNPDLRERKGPTGVGSKTLTAADESLLLQLRKENPTMQLKDYRRVLLECNGTAVSESVLCRWFSTQFTLSGRKKPAVRRRKQFTPKKVDGSLKEI